MLRSQTEHAWFASSVGPLFNNRNNRPPGPSMGDKMGDGGKRGEREPGVKLCSTGPGLAGTAFVDRSFATMLTTHCNAA